MTTTNTTAVLSTSTLAAELATLRAVCTVHRAKVIAAVEAADEAAEAFASVYGANPWDLPELAEGWRAARAKVEELDHLDGYYWATSRMWDLERLLEPPTGQLVLRCGAYVPKLGGDIPVAHACVAPFVLATLGLA